MADSKGNPEANAIYSDEATPISLAVVSGTNNTRALTVQGVTTGGAIPISTGLSADSITPDSSTNNFNGTLSGTTLPALELSRFTNFINNFRFDGVDRGSTAAQQSIDCGVNGVSVTGNFTIDAKIVISAVPVNVEGTIAGKATHNKINCKLSIDTSRKLVGRFTDSTNAVAQVVGGTALALNTKYDVSLDYDGAQLRVYVNGVQDGAFIDGNGLLAPDTTTNFSIGKSNESDNNGSPFAGTIDEVRFSKIARYGGTNYTPVTTPYVTDSNTVGLWHLDYVTGVSYTVPMTSGGTPLTSTSNALDINLKTSSITLPVSGTVSANQGTTPWLVGGDIASGVTDNGNPVKIGGEADSTAPAAVTAGQRVDAWFGLNGQLATSLTDISGNLVGVTSNALDVNLKSEFTGTLNNGAETAVAASAVQVLAAGTYKKIIIQNTGAANVRIGVTGVASTTGFRLVPNGTAIIDGEGTPQNAIFAIREGAVSSTVFATNIS